MILASVVGWSGVSFATGPRLAAAETLNHVTEPALCGEVPHSAVERRRDWADLAVAQFNS